MLSLLLIAPTCDGQDIGEAWVGYQWVRHLAGRHQLTVLTYHKRGRVPLAGQVPGARIVQWPEPPLLGRAERLNSMLKPGYVPFYLRARRWVQAALARGERFDVAHQPVPVAMRYPSPVAGLGIPFVLGPVGGGLSSPPGFAAEEGTAPWYAGLRQADQWRLRHDPLLRHSYEQAGCVVGIAPYVHGLLSGLALRGFEIMSETGIEDLPVLAARPAGTGGPVRLLFVGRLVRTKGARDAIRAMGLAGDIPARLDVVGDGFDRPACEALTAELGLTRRVFFHGWLPRAQVTRFYQDADVFVFPSYREPGGNVTMEALAHGLPLVVSDLGGPGHVVDSSCGIRVHPVSPAQYASDLAAALTRLVRDEALRLALGAGARKRVVAAGLWDSKVAQMEEIYAKVAGRGHSEAT